MKAFNFFQILHQRNPLLSATGWIHAGLCVIFLCLMPFDERLVQNINPWIKPLKFALSIIFFTWTMGWIMYELQEKFGRVKRYSKLFAITSFIEMLIITLQAARGTTSHFNVFHSPFDAILFSIMGIFITLNLIVIILVCINFFTQKTALPVYLLWAIRLGLISIILASLEGFVMVRMLAHTVGAADGGPGLPLVKWSTIAGDLRIAHFLGMHGLQIFPIFGYLLSKWQKENSLQLKTSMVISLACLYLLLMNFTFWQAMNKKPLIADKHSVTVYKSK